MTFSDWTPSLLPALVRFWNRSFAQRRHFIPVTPALLRERVFEHETPSEGFDPKRFLVARERGEIVGLIHVGLRPEAQVRVYDPDWPGGAQGYVALLFVDPARRRRGIGTELWHRGLERLKGARQVVVDGQALNPFYGNSEGPSTPLWGTPEGIGVEWGDSATKKFLARKGFAPRFRGLQLGLDLATCEASLVTARKAASRQGYELREFDEEYPELGRRTDERRALRPGLRYGAVAAIARGRVSGLVSYYPMPEAEAGLYGIYEAVLIERLRGRALGRHLLAAAMARMKARGGLRVEVLTLPEYSPRAYKRYLAAGFQPVCAWAIY